jgi:hypothetical protein
MPLRDIKIAIGRGATSALKRMYRDNPAIRRKPRIKPKRNPAELGAIRSEVERLRSLGLKDAAIIGQLRLDGYALTDDDEHAFVVWLLEREKIARRRPKKSKRPRQSEEQLAWFDAAVALLYSVCVNYKALLDTLHWAGFAWARHYDVANSIRRQPELERKLERAPRPPDAVIEQFDSMVQNLYFRGWAYKKMIAYLKQAGFLFANIGTIDTSLDKLAEGGKIVKSRKRSGRKALVEGRMITWDEYLTLRQGNPALGRGEAWLGGLEEVLVFKEEGL